MPLYYYTARSAQGAFLHGSIQAATDSAALSGLRARLLCVTSIARSTSVTGAASAALQGGPASRKELAIAFRSFAALAHSGVPVRRALEIAMEQCRDKRLREALAGVANDVETGHALSDAMARRPKEFAPLHVALVRAGEIGGILDEVLERLAAMLEREEALRKRIAGALAYPAVVACSACALIVFLLASIVPMFQSMFEQLHAPLPPITALLLAAGSALRWPPAWAAAGIVAATTCGVFVRATRSESGRLAVENLALRLPLVGVIRRRSAAARVARMLGTLLRSGVPLTASLEVVMDAVRCAPFRHSLSEVRQAIAEGIPISQTLARTAVYEPLFVQLTRVGEETGALDAMLLRIADYYDADVEAALASLSSLLEPALILLLGSAVGFIVAAIFVPLYTLIGNMK